MSRTNRSPFDLLSAAGIDVEDGVVARLRAKEARQLQRMVAADPDFGVAQILKARGEAQTHKAACERSVEAAENLERILKELLEGVVLLCPLERLAIDDHGSCRALCNVGGQLQELGVHPEVELDELSALEPWEYVAVQPREMVVVGVMQAPEFYARAHGSVVEFKGYQDRALGLVRVRRQGEEECVVGLSGALREQPLLPGARLVLRRNDERFAIAVAAAEPVESRFEFPIRSIETRVEHLAGLDPVVEIFLENALMHIVHPEIGQRAQLKPLRGVTLFSYMPGMGKTMLMRALAATLQELGDQRGFDVVLHVVKPNELQSKWHGEDAYNVREELCGPIWARQNQPRSRPLFQLVVIDEADSLGKRGGGEDGYHSPARNDVVQSLLAELDGMGQHGGAHHPPAQVLWVALTNRPDMLDDALARPGRFCDRLIEMPAPNTEMAEGVLAVHAGHGLPWYLDGQVRTDLSEAEVRARLLRPALLRVFDQTVLRYSTDGRQSVPVTAGRIMSNAHYANCINAAKYRLSKRLLFETGVPALGFDDVLASLIEQAASCGRQMAADRGMLARQLRVGPSVARVDAVGEDELAALRFVREREEELQVS